MSEKDTAINYTWEAFRHPLNLAMLALAGITAILSYEVGLMPSAIMTMAIGMDLVYLGVVPKMPRFQRHVRMKKMKERDSAAEEKDLFRELDPRSQKRFLVLKRFSTLVRENFEKLPYTSHGLLENITRKMDELLANYITLLDLYKRYELYMNSAVEEGIRTETERIRERMSSLESEPLKNTKARRLQILEKRLKKFELAKEKYLICETHLETIEDAIRYIYEQSMTMNNAEEVGFQLDNLLSEVEETSQLIDDLDHDILPAYDIYDLDSALDAATAVNAASAAATKDSQTGVGDSDSTDSGPAGKKAVGDSPGSESAGDEEAGDEEPGESSDTTSKQKGRTSTT